MKVLEVPEVLEEEETARQEDSIFSDKKNKNHVKDNLDQRRKVYGLNFLPSLYKKFEIKKKNTLKNLLSGKCSKHSRQLELLCIKDKVRICTDCALFGAHKKHSILTFKDAVIREESAFGMILSSAIRLKGQLSDIIDENGLPSNFHLKLLQICNEKRRELKKQLNLKIEVNPKIIFIFYQKIF